MHINREQFLNELKLRKQIRRAIGVIKKKKLNEETKLRSLIRSLILQEAQATDIPTEVPHKSTGINVLEDLLKKIIPVLEDDFKSLTTDETQRVSFRSHIIMAVKNSLAAPKVNVQAGGDGEKEKFVPIKEQDINVKVQDDADVGEEAFIDIEPEEEVEKDPKEDFGIPGEDETGRNVAYASYNKVEKNILDSYDVLSNEEDRETFYDYLITNLKLYFDKFEDELQTSVQEPTTPEYEAAEEPEPASL
tara:strand:+ start:441 stop:1184 length:744 start_codon:yes stop_codon:yes gene_type:complete